MANLRIGIPVYDKIDPNTVASLWSLSKTDSVLEILIGTYIDEARNKIIEHLEEPYLLFIDGDMVFNQSDVMKLMEAMEADPKLGAVSGLYVKRKGDEMPVCNWMKDGEWLEDEERRKWAADCRGVVEVGSFGMGLTLCRGAALNDMEFPYMESGYTKDHGYMSEDSVFCIKMRAAGWKTAVHFGVRIGHVGQEVWWPKAVEEKKEVALAV